MCVFFDTSKNATFLWKQHVSPPEIGCRFSVGKNHISIKCKIRRFFIKLLQQATLMAKERAKCPRTSASTQCNDERVSDGRGIQVAQRLEQRMMTIMMLKVTVTVTMIMSRTMMPCDLFQKHGGKVCHALASCGHPGMMMTPEARSLGVLGWASGVGLVGWVGYWVVRCCVVACWVGWWVSWCQKFSILWKKKLKKKKKKQKPKK